jgi:GNAT superfamily N-acetyltransferase
VSIAIRAAVPGDEELIFDLIRSLADFEKLLHEVEANPGNLAAVLFSDHPKVFCDIAEVNGAPAGFALWFYSFSTFVGRHGIYLEDLFVRPEHRRAGVGRALFRNLARRCVAENLGRFEWAVLKWNRQAIDFYEGQGAKLLDDWVIGRLTGAPRRALAAEPS